MPSLDRNDACRICGLHYAGCICPQPRPTATIKKYTAGYYVLTMGDRQSDFRDLLSASKTARANGYKVRLERNHA